MPRADPTRSDYCASRHLLRNLDDAGELRRNPLVRDYFPAAAGHRRHRDAARDGAVLDRIRDRARTALARCFEHARDCTPVALGRMHAVLLRCEIDDRPPAAVAEEMGLSERQLRRERAAAHDAFVRAFRAADQGTAAPSATVCDVVTLRLAEAVELHELGDGALAQSAFDAIAASAPAAARRIEALCLASAAELDALRYAAAAAHLDDARRIVVRCSGDLDGEAARAADEHVEFVAWLLRLETGGSAGLAAQPPIALTLAGDDRARDESRRALLVRAAAAYAMQRWEIGDYAQGYVAVKRGLGVVETLHPARTKERLALMMADAQIYGLRAQPGADRDRFHGIETLAAAHGHVRTMLVARAERIVAEILTGPDDGTRSFDDVLRTFGPLERRTMARTFAWVAHSLMQSESNRHDALAIGELAERMVPALSVIALVARCVRVNVAIDAHRYDEARKLARSVYSDAQATGNGRLRAAAARSLAVIALRCRRRSEAQRHIREALSLGERFAPPIGLARTNALARRLDVA